MKPIAITMGDPAGIGPEILVKLAAEPAHPAHLIAIGDIGVLRAAAAAFAPELEIAEIDHPADAASPKPGRLEVIQPASPLAPPPQIGVVDARAGLAAYQAIRAAIEYAKSGDIAAMVTAPIHKEALTAAGLTYPGHTEMLAEHGGADGEPLQVAMMLANDELRVVLVTIHMSLLDAIKAADLEANLAAIRLANEGARAFGVAFPRVAVAGLNPHAGEGGRFGREEIDIIQPAIAAARAEGVDASGPWPGDTVFMQARAGRFDVVVAQYHDQGLIPVKYLGLEQGVNVTLGLPFVRTSPDHGVAFDIAGKGVANPSSLRTAVREAVKLATARGA
ncbi:MAG: 4-hydroxythreonine-4-phosphate dehydrogenase PdxA [Neomegalonema sp.]|nr:4-hydroxythreonine-4-phosphate dehydrogenase PdxA [Neomegalonema sp.]